MQAFGERNVLYGLVGLTSQSRISAGRVLTIVNGNTGGAKGELQAGIGANKN